MNKKILFILIAILCLGINVNAKELTEDIQLSSNITDGIHVGENKTVELNLNDYKISGVYNDTATIYNEGTLTISGLGTVSSEEAKPLIINKGSLVIENGTYSGGEITVLNDGKLTIKGGSFTKIGGEVIHNNKNLMVTNGTFTGQVLSNNELTIRKGTFNGVVTLSNKAIIKDGTFTLNLIADGAGTEVTVEKATILNVSTRSGAKLDLQEVKVSGQILIQHDSTLLISGGEIDGAIDNRSPASTIKISGGVFKNVVVADYLEDGYVTRQRSDKKYIVLDPNNISLKMVKESIDNLVDEEEQIVEEAIKDNDYKIGTSYDVTIKEVTNKGEELGTVSETEEELEVTLEIPSELQNVPEDTEREYAIVRVHEGVADILDTTDNKDGTLTAKSNLFSTYIITYKDTKLSGNNQNTNNDNNTTINNREEETNTSTNTTTSTSSNITNPKTHDNILFLVIVLLTSTIGLITTKKLIKNN